MKSAFCKISRKYFSHQTFITFLSRSLRGKISYSSVSDCIWLQFEQISKYFGSVRQFSWILFICKNDVLIQNIVRFVHIVIDYSLVQKNTSKIWTNLRIFWISTSYFLNLVYLEKWKSSFLPKCPNQ